MLKKPPRTTAIVVGLATLLVETAYATRFDSKSIDRPPLAPPMVRLPGHVLKVLAKAESVKLPAKAGSEPIPTLTLVLKRDREKAFKRYLREVYDPHSRNYHHFLKQRDIAARFGPHNGLLTWCSPTLSEVASSWFRARTTG